MPEPLVPPAPDVLYEACAWVAQLETGQLSSEDLAAFREWIRRSPRHFSEIRRVALIAGQANVLAQMAGALQSAAESLDPIVAPRRGGSPRWRMAMAAVLVILALGVGGFFLLAGNRPTGYVIATQIGAIKETRLSDGSIVKLNTDSRIEVTFTKAQRRVRLLKGESFFAVAHNPDRPFIVYVGDKYVRAVGTAFAVRRTDNDLLVTVSEGRVEVNEVSASPEAARVPTHASAVATQAQPKPLLITAGHRLVVDNTGKDTVEMISNRKLARDLSWRDGLLDFADMPLSEVVRQWSRYTDLKFEIADRDLQDLKFDGIFRTNEIGAFLDALEHSFGVHVEYVDDKTIRLQHSATSPTRRT
jgi:transmembrane sensor